MLPEATRLPSALKHTLRTPPGCPWRVRVTFPVCASQIFTVWSLLAEASRLPSGLKHTLRTPLVCPWRVRTSCPVAVSHTFTVLSALPRNNAFAVRGKTDAGDAVGMPPDGAYLLPRGCVPQLDFTGAFARSAPLTEATCLSSGLNATLQTVLVCPGGRASAGPWLPPTLSPSCQGFPTRCACRRG